MTSLRFRRAFLFAFAALSLPLGACLETVGPEEEEPQIRGVVVAAPAGSAASGSLTAAITGGQPTQSGALTLQSGTSNALTVSALGLDLLDEPVVAEHHADFEIRFLMNDTPLTSTMGTGYPLVVSVRPEGTGTQTYELQVVSIDHNHVEFTIPIVVTVQ